MPRPWPFSCRPWKRTEDRDDIFFNLGLAYQSWQKFKSAAKYYKQSLRLNPDNDVAVQELLYCLEVSERLESNLEFFRRFTDDDPYSAMAWYNLGQAYFRAGTVRRGHQRLRVRHSD